jgi:hypothetical protein
MVFLNLRQVFSMNFIDECCSNRLVRRLFYKPWQMRRVEVSGPKVWRELQGSSCLYGNSGIAFTMNIINRSKRYIHLETRIGCIVAYRHPSRIALAERALHLRPLYLNET